MSIKKKIIGSFDLIFLFGRGIEAFEGVKRSAIRSMLLSFCLFPLTLAAAYFYPPKGMEQGFGYLQIAGTVSAQYILAFVLSNILIAAIAKALNKLGKFWLFFEASNWTGFVFSVITLPFAVMAVTTVIPREQMDRIFVLVGCYGYIVTACIVYRAFRVNWQLAGAVSIISLFVNEELWHALYALQGIPQPW